MIKIKKLAILVALLIAASPMMLAACGEPSDTEGDGSQGGQSNPTQDGEGDGSSSGTAGGIVTVPSRINIDIDDGPLVLPYTLTGGEGPVEWTSDYSSVAAVDANGKLYPVTEGTTTITARTSTYVTTFEVNVTDLYGSYTKISTADQIENLAKSTAYNKKTAKYCLTNDIDFGGREIQPIGGWGDAGKAFNAIFDGRGYALKNFVIREPESCKVVDETTGNAEYFGVSLFPFVDTGTIRNLSLVNVRFEGTGFTGGIAGQLESGLIENCYVSGTVSAAEGFTKSVPSGGICGIMGAKGVVKDVFMSADVLGGFVFAGFNFGTGSNCVARAEAITAVRNGETLLLCTDNTGKTGEEGDAENEQLKQFDEATSLILKDTMLTALRNYPFTRSSNWAIMSGYTAFVARPDGIAPEWAKSAVK